FARRNALRLPAVLGRARARRVAEPDVTELEADPDRPRHRSRVRRPTNGRLHGEEDEEIVQIERLLVELAGGEKGALHQIAGPRERTAQQGEISDAERAPYGAVDDDPEGGVVTEGGEHRQAGSDGVATDRERAVGNIVLVREPG